MFYETILTWVDDDVLTITMTGPERPNAWTSQMGAEMVDAIGAANNDPDKPVIVTTISARRSRSRET